MNHYRIAVYNPSGENRVTLTTLLEEEYLSISENQALSSQLNLEDSQYYRFRLESDSGVDSVSFQVTSLSGQ